MTGDFNISDSLQNLFFSYHLSISDDLLIIADSFNLNLLIPTNSYPTRYSDTEGEANSVIDLMFLCNESNELNSHLIHPDWCLTSDYAPLTITISIMQKNVTSTKLSILENSKKETAFIKEIIADLKNLNTSNIMDSDKLEDIVNLFKSIIKQVWNKNAKQMRITKHSKQWWNNECSQALDKYRTTRSPENWKIYKKVVKTTKRSFFDNKIQEIANKSQGLWKLIDWVNKQKLPTTEAIKYDNQPYLSPNSLQKALYFSFNTVLYKQVDVEVLEEISDKLTTFWNPFSKEEFRQAINKYNNSSVPGLNKLTWRHLKFVLKQNDCLNNIINIADACIILEYWPNHFKRSTMIVIPKPNKQTYDYPKSFCPIVLLNTLGKLIKKVIAERLQFHVVANNFIDQSQLGGLKFKSTTNVDIALTHIIHLGQVKNNTTSTLAFDIAQFFLSLNHHCYN